MWTLKTLRPSSEVVKTYIEKSYQQLISRDDLGFKDLELLKLSVSECRQLSGFYKDKKKLVIVGLGGSSLGAKALCEALYPNDWNDKVEFLDNVDSFTIDSFLERVVRPEDIGWVVISKSGGTIEVLSLLDYCSEFFQSKHNFSITKNMVVITEEKESLLKEFSNKNNIPCLPVPKNVGGRFSVFTPVGLFPLGFLGFDFDKAIVGFESALSNKDQVVDLSTQLYESIGREEFNFYCFHYSDRLSQWAGWLQQLWSESLAKSLDRNGNDGPVVSTFIPCRGASDQHSVLQQVVEGREKKFACFVRVESSEAGFHKIKRSLLDHKIMESKGLGELLGAEAQATEQVLNEVGVSTVCLKVQDLDSQTMTQMMGLWMLTVGTLGEAFDINAFNQPGVESGKVIARRVLSNSH